MSRYLVGTFEDIIGTAIDHEDAIGPGTVDFDILTAVGASGFACRGTFERVRQDGRWYYRLLLDGRPGGALTDAAHARETIAYWRAKGWLSYGAD